MRVLLVNVESGIVGGREQLSALLAEGVRKVVGDGLEIHQLPRNGPKPKIAERLRGRIDGITCKYEINLQQQMLRSPPDCVILDGSNLGRLARLIKQQNSAIPTITFYHNVEALFFFDSLRCTRSFHSAGVLVANYVAERWATRHSDFRITLNKRDSELLGTIYGRQATDLSPMAGRDFYNPLAATNARPLKEKYALFVGGAFHANVLGMAWYAENIAPQSPLLTIVVGRGMEAYRDRLEQWGGIQVVGAVDDLTSWYAHAQIVVAPILSGSGMKTKTAEALMHGKPIAGTPEAFVGYRHEFNDNLKLCKDHEDFLSALNESVDIDPSFNRELRAEYDQYHSEEAMRLRIQSIFRRALGKAIE